MENVNQVLYSYNIQPADIRPVSKRLNQVHNANTSFALKRSMLNAGQLSNWHDAYRTAEKYNLKSILPVYLNNRGEIFEQHNGEIYYLSPWKEKKEYDEPEHQLESFYQAVGTIHNRTKQSNDIAIEKTEEAVELEKQKIDSYRGQLLTFIGQFEARHYMAPFELLVCTQYRDLEQVLMKASEWYDYYLKDLQGDKRMFHALCHGDLRDSHVIYQNTQTYLINWERSFYGNPVMDLAIYFYNEFKYHDSPLTHLAGSFSIYEKYNPLLQSEKSLLAIYLLNLRPYLQVIEEYNKNKDKAQPFHIRSLEYSYRRLMQGLSMQHYFQEQRPSPTEQSQED